MGEGGAPGKDTVADADAVVASRKAVAEQLAAAAVQYPVELLEVGEGRLPHPHDEVVVDEAVVVRLVRVQLVHGPPPVRRLGGACKTNRE